MGNLTGKLSWNLIFHRDFISFEVISFVELLKRNGSLFWAANEKTKLILVCLRSHHFHFLLFIVHPRKDQLPIGQDDNNMSQDLLYKLWDNTTVEEFIKVLAAGVPSFFGAKVEPQAWEKIRRKCN